MTETNPLYLLCQSLLLPVCGNINNNGHDGHDNDDVKSTSTSTSTSTSASTSSSACTVSHMPLKSTVVHEITECWTTNPFGLHSIHPYSPIICSGTIYGKTCLQHVKNLSCILPQPSEEELKRHPRFPKARSSYTIDSALPDPTFYWNTLVQSVVSAATESDQHERMCTGRVIHAGVWSTDEETKNEVVLTYDNDYLRLALVIDRRRASGTFQLIRKHGGQYESNGTDSSKFACTFESCVQQLLGIGRGIAPFFKDPLDIVPTNSYETIHLPPLQIMLNYLTDFIRMHCSVPGATMYLGTQEHIIYLYANPDTVTIPGTDRPQTVLMSELWNHPYDCFHSNHRSEDHVKLLVSNHVQHCSFFVNFQLPSHSSHPLLHRLATPFSFSSRHWSVVQSQMWIEGPTNVDPSIFTVVRVVSNYMRSCICLRTNQVTTNIIVHFILTAMRSQTKMYRFQIFATMHHQIGLSIYIMENLTRTITSTGCCIQFHLLDVEPFGWIWRAWKSTTVH